MQSTVDFKSLESSANWEAHRPIITRLYIKEGKTLKAVMAIMERDYRLLASMKMYKARLAQWGLTKNITARDLPELLHQIKNEPSRDLTALVVRGRRVPPERAQRYLKRKATIAPATPAAPAPRLMSLPVDLRTSYDVVQLSRQFIAGYADGTSSVWYPSVELRVWSNNMSAAGTLIKRHRFKQAFKLLNTAFDRLKEFIRNPEPTFFIFVYYILFQLPRDICQRLCTYVAQISAILLPSHHPITLIWSKLNQTDPRIRLDYGWTILHSYFQILKQQFHHDKSSILNFSRVFYLFAFKLDLVDLDTIEVVLKDAIQGLSRKTDVLSTQLELGDVLLGNAKHKAAEKIIHEAKEAVHQKEAGWTRCILLDYYSLAFDIQKALGRTEGTVELGRKLVRLFVGVFGFTSGATLTAIHDVQSYWAKVGKFDEARQLLHIFDAGDELEQKLRAYIQDMDTADGDGRVYEVLDSW